MMRFVVFIILFICMLFVSLHFSSLRSNEIGAFAQDAKAHENHESLIGVQAERANLMKGLASTLKQLGQLNFNGNESTKIKELAEVLVDSADKMLYTFPEGSNEPPSEALDIIWQQPEQFEAIVNEFAGAALQLLQQADMINSKQQLQVHMQAIGKTCGACHRQFRKKK